MRLGPDHRRLRRLPAALWPRLVELGADVATVALWTEREIPVVVLERR